MQSLPRRGSRNRAIFFDAGFTLICPTRSLPCIIQEVGAMHNVYLEERHIVTAIEKAFPYYQAISRGCWSSETLIAEMWVQYYTHLFTLLHPRGDPELVAVIANAIYQVRELPASWSLYPDVPPLWDYLKRQSYAIGIISDWGSSLPAILQHNRLVADCVVVSAHLGVAKPSSALFQDALERMGCAPQDAVHVGDSDLDIIGARNAHITPVWLNRSQERLGGSDCEMIATLSALPALLERRACPL